MTDVTLRRQPVPPEIEAAGGFGVGLEMAFPVGDGCLQPMGPGVVFLVVPMGRERSEVRTFFPLGITMESRKRLVEELMSAWPGEKIYGDDMPWWAARDFDRRALFEAIATGRPLPPGAPARRRRGDPLPWRDPFATEHGCERLQSTSENLSVTSDGKKQSIRVPGRRKDRVRWKAIWMKVRPERARNKSYKEMADWVSKDPNLKVSPDILAEIIRAGEAGQLDE